MKGLKYISMIAVIAMLAISCDPLEDEVKEIEESQTLIKDLIYTLTDEDYELAGEGFGTFSDIDDVKSMVPVILSTNFPVLGENSSALVSYQFYNGSSPDLRKTQFIYTVTSEEYDALGFGFGNFSNLSKDLPKYAEFKEPGAGDGNYMDVTHDYYNGSFTETDIVSRVVYTVAYGWQYAFILPDDVYGDFFFESGIDFSNSDEGAEKIPAYLNYLLTTGDDFFSLSTEEGKILVVQYNFDDRCFDDCGGDPGAPNVPDVEMYIFNGTEWVSYGDAFQTTTESLNFGHDGSVWVPDNTIKYTITGADFGAIVTEGLGNAGAISNLDQFGNFNTGNWSHEEIVVAISFILNKNFPSNEEGQKYFVTYNTYPGGDLTVSLILDANGEYVEPNE